MGLRVSVYRDASGADTTNGGISSEVERLTVVNVEGPFEPNADAPPVMLVKAGRNGDYPVLFRAERRDGDWIVRTRSSVVGPMFGGNYAASSDSRFSRAVGHYGAVPIHDRFESPELNEVLSR